MTYVIAQAVKATNLLKEVKLLGGYFEGSWTVTLFCDVTVNY